MLENHGVVTAGDGLQQAFERFETLEFAAKTLIKAGMLGTVRTLETDPADLAPRPPSPPPFEPGPASSREKDLRRQLSEFVRRAYQQRLMISTQGAFSARLGEDSFLITPHGVDRSRIDVADLVLVREGSPEAGKEPSGSARNHRAIYRAHPSIQSVVNAYPVNATAFGVDRHHARLADHPRELPVPQGREPGPLRRPVRRRRRAGPAGLAQGADPDPRERRRAGLGDERPGRLRPARSPRDDGRGDDRTRRPMGEMVPMSDEAIADLKAAFNME